MRRLRDPSALTATFMGKMPSTGQTSRTGRTNGPGGTPSATQGAAALATLLLQGVGLRLDHSACVALQIRRAAGILEPEWRSALEAAAWLHDIGYKPELALTAFHPLDGARWLRDHSWPTETCRLVAWHTESVEEARLYGLDRELAAEFDRPPRLASAALAWADLTSSPPASAGRWSTASPTSSSAIRLDPSCTRRRALRCLPCVQRFERSKNYSAASDSPISASQPT
jgi:HD domain